GSGYLSNSGTCSQFRCDHLGRSCPPTLTSRSLVEHVADPTRLRDHSGSAALLAHVQWAPGCDAASCHSRVPTLKMPASWNTGRPVKRAATGAQR
ncbi:unnamed protein product, partial [Staurois parvus]